MKTTLAICTTPALFAFALPAQDLVSPSDRANYEGSTYTAYPLGRFNTRVQQLHSDLGTAARSFVAHGYRRDAAEVKGAIAGFASEMTVVLAMSPKTPGTASTTFADNLGTQSQVVLPRTKLNFPASDRPAIDPYPAFTFGIPYQVPFAYPAGGGTLCIDVTIHGNDAPSGTDRDFLPYLDAQDVYADGRVLQVGYRYGQGCVAATQRNAQYGELAFVRSGSALELQVTSRYGIPGDLVNPAYTGLLVGYAPAQVPFPKGVNCTLWTTSDHAVLFASANDATGGWTGAFSNMPLMGPGTTFYAQVASVQPSTLSANFGDGTRIVVPPAGKVGLPAVRIAAASDRTATSGTVATQVAIVKLF